MTNTTAFYVTFVMFIGQLCSFWRHNPFRLFGGILLTPLVVIMLLRLGPTGRALVMSQILIEMEQADELKRYPNWAVHVMANRTRECLERLEDSDD